MNIFKEKDGYVTKLKQVYDQHGSLFIGVDFDDTIKDYDTGEEISPVTIALRKCNIYGLKLCLYTAREGKDLVEAVKFCEAIGVDIDYQNYSPLMPWCRKPLFNLLLDDKAGLKEALSILNELLNYIKEKKI